MMWGTTPEMNCLNHARLKTLNTERPFTPLNSQRVSFGSRAFLKPSHVANLSQWKLYDVETLPYLQCVPELGPSVRLTNRGPTKSKRYKLPAIKKTNHAKRLFTSLDNLLEELDNEKIENWQGADSKCLPSRSSKNSQSLDLESQNWVPSMSYVALKRMQSGANTLTFENPEKMERNNEKFDQFEETCQMEKPASDQTDSANYDNCINEAKALETNKMSSGRELTMKQNESLSLDAVLVELKVLDHVNIDEERTLQLFDNLNACIKEEGLASRYCPHSKLKSNILKNIYSYVENGTDPILLKIAHISLALKVKGPNISSVCKLIFKVSRSAKNDEYFLQGDLLDLFVESLTTPLEDPGPLIYAYGALKFLTMNRAICQSLLDRGILQLMVLHLKLVNAAHAEGFAIDEQTSHAIFQLSGTLRHVAAASASQFVPTGALQQLCITLQQFIFDIDLVANISRTLSILSTREDCCLVLLESKMLSTFMLVLAKFPGRQDIVIRLAYVMGNMLALGSAARFQLYDESGALNFLINLLEIYMRRDLKEMQTNILKEEREKYSDSSENVIVKLIRIFANLTTEPEVGGKWVCEIKDLDNIMRPEQKDECLKLTKILLTILQRKSVSESEEIIVAALVTLNNMTFYSIEGPLRSKHIEIAQGLTCLMRTSNTPCLIETTRILGNLTRDKAVCQFFSEIGGMAELNCWLSTSNTELLYTATGISVNLTADSDSRVLFKNLAIVERLVVILQKYCESDWNLAAVVCQALWNLVYDSDNIFSKLSSQSAHELLSALIHLLDEDSIFQGETEESKLNSEDYHAWEHFAEISTNLLEKLEFFLTTNS